MEGSFFAQSMPAQHVGMVRDVEYLRGRTENDWSWRTRRKFLTYHSVNKPYVPLDVLNSNSWALVHSKTLGCRYDSQHMENLNIMAREAGIEEELHAGGPTPQIAVHNGPNKRVGRGRGNRGRSKQETAERVYVAQQQPARNFSLIPVNGAANIVQQRPPGLPEQLVPFPLLDLKPNEQEISLQTTLDQEVEQLTRRSDMDEVLGNGVLLSKSPADYFFDASAISVAMTPKTCTGLQPKSSVVPQEILPVKSSSTTPSDKSPFQDALTALPNLEGDFFINLLKRSVPQNDRLKELADRLLDLPVFPHKEMFLEYGQAITQVSEPSISNLILLDKSTPLQAEQKIAAKSHTLSEEPKFVLNMTDNGQVKQIGMIHISEEQLQILADLTPANQVTTGWLSGVQAGRFRASERVPHYPCMTEFANEANTEFTNELVEQNQ